MAKRTNRKARMIGRFIVADPEVCGGKPSFRGTRYSVASVLEDIARGLDWQTISSRRGGRVTRHAIAEAACIAEEAINDHWREYVSPPDDLVTNGNKVKRRTRYIVADPRICHGKPTFRGTRIMVWQVVEMLAEGEYWPRIVEECHNSFTTEAIAEVARLTADAFEEHALEYAAPEYVLERVPA